MKKNIFLGMLLAIAAAGYSQEIKPATILTRHDYLKKSKQQKTAAWVLLGVGTTLGGIGTFMFLKEAAKVPLAIIPLPGQPQPDEAKVNGGGILMLLGGAAVITSVPLFVAAGKNKTKAAVISFKNVPIQVLQKNNFVNTYTPSVNVTIPF
jgi:hypothetical protein